MTDYRPAGLMADEKQNNAGGAQRLNAEGKPYHDAATLSEYPRMLYRKTEAELIQPWADAIAELKDKPMVINKYDGLLCETKIVNSQTEAEAFAEEGWETSPKAAHGIEDGIGKVVSAKDQEIARLTALLAAKDEPAQERRGPGRPRLAPAE